FTPDGFGRPIRTDDGGGLQIPRIDGYDTRGRVVWSARMANPTSYAKPTMTTSGLYAMTEDDYDLADRIVAERRWVIETGEILTKTYDYDDKGRTTTVTDRGVASSTTVDGLGRVVSRRAADGSTTTTTHYVDHDVVKTQTNQGTQLVRTIQRDTRD